MTMKTKDEYLSQLQDRLLKQQTENDEERTRLQNLVAKMEVQIREHSRKFEEDKWKLSQVNPVLQHILGSLFLGLCVLFRPRFYTSHQYSV